jgi:CheY-like chemotaxis protein
VVQILENLLTNARDALGEQGRVSIETGVVSMNGDKVQMQGAHSGSYAFLAVSDNGAGMDESVRARIFEPFFTTKPPGLGTGLGLSMIYGLAKQHGGFVTVDSAAGRGTTVRVFFPSGFPVPQAEAPQPAGSELRGNETILLVDDEEPIRRTARRILERYGYRVLLASDGAEALNLIREHGSEIQLVISDVAMPKMGGKGLYDAARSDGAKMRFLFASGYTARDIGATGEFDPTLPFVRKPWTMEDFVRRVRETLSSPLSPPLSGEWNRQS